MTLPLAQQLGLKRLADWAQVAPARVRAQGVVPPQGSVWALAQAAHPAPPRHALALAPFDCTPAPRGWWTDPASVAHYLEVVGVRGGVRRWADWAGQGRGVLPPTLPPLRALLLHAHPEAPWHAAWPLGDARAALDQLGVQQEVRRYAGWRSVRARALEGVRGAPFKRLGRSPLALLTHLYPEAPWLPWEHWGPRRWWQDAGKVAWALRWAEGRLGVAGDEWKRVSLGQLRALGLAHALQQAGGLALALRALYPDLQLAPPAPTMRGRRAAQRELRARVQALLPGEQVLEEAPLGPLRLDLLLPAWGLALELDGPQHALPHLLHRDALKLRLAQAQGLQLIRLGLPPPALPALARTLLHTLGPAHPLSPRLLRASEG